MTKIKLPQAADDLLAPMAEQDVPDSLWYRIEDSLKKRKEERSFWLNPLLAPIPLLLIVGLFFSVQFSNKMLIEREIAGYLDTLYSFEYESNDDIYL